MPAMENALSCTKPSNHQSSFRHRRSGYEPSDTETEWQDSPWHEGLSIPNRPRTPPGPERAISPLNHSQRNISKEESNYTSVKALGTSSATRRNSRSPYKPVRGAGDVAYSDLRRNISPLKVSEHHRHVSPYKARTKGSEHENNELKNSFQKRSQRTPPKIHNSSQKDTQSQLQEVSRVSERSKHSRNRAMSAPKLRAREKDQQFSSNSAVRGTDQISPLVKATIHNQQVGTCARSSSPKEINEVIASRKLSKSPSYDAHLTESTESVSFGDIFFSRDGTIPQKNSGMNNSNNRKKFAPSMKPVLERKAPLLYQESRGIKSSDQNPQAITVSTVLSRTNTSFGSAAGRLSSGRTNTSSNSAVGPLSRTSNDSSKFSDGSGKSGSFRKFTANIQRSQTEAWFSCVRRASCGKSKSPEYRAIDEATFIGKAIVVEELRMFWADKHSPHSLNGFICHKQQTQHLRQLTSHSSFPHLLFKGPSGSGKKSLCMAFLHEIFGDASLKVSHDLRHFYVQIMEVLIEIAKKENFELSTSFAARIATRSKQNLRKAIMALEACKAHNFPFVDDQPIPLGWEDVLVELAAEILADPSPKRLFLIRGKFQKLLVEFVPPKLILQKLVEQFLKGIEAGLKRELYYWHAYYDKRLPAGTSALLKLEEFVAKFMSIHRKSF
uniref:Uncharacterized protein LOC105058758 isoform X3 n=1 Tax=Elaeis guineensis var. tenera TaxID=51953 RepID=A0A8N4IHG0_ELAGV|nr:uncharacterized protein LOC105058758 isoform X3 [Elaeis guineensis]